MLPLLVCQIAKKRLPQFVDRSKHGREYLVSNIETPSALALEFPQLIIDVKIEGRADGQMPSTSSAFTAITC